MRFFDKKNLSKKRPKNDPHCNPKHFLVDLGRKRGLGHIYIYIYISLSLSLPLPPPSFYFYFAFSWALSLGLFLLLFSLLFFRFLSLSLYIYIYLSLSLAHVLSFSLSLFLMFTLACSSRSFFCSISFPCALLYIFMPSPLAKSSAACLQESGQLRVSTCCLTR